jgi:hypothetical protein
MATQEQKNQLIAKIATSADPKKWGEVDKFQRFVGLQADDFDEELGKLLIAWQPPVRTSCIIQIDPLPYPTVPTWSRGRILTGVTPPQTLDINQLMKNAWQHAHQTGENQRPTGHDILATLVKSYVVGKDKAGMTYQVEPTDLINGHLGFRELSWLGKDWITLPEPFRKWANGKLLYGWADVVRSDDGDLGVPYLNCIVPTPYVVWYDLDRRWDGYEFALREQVSPQS